MRETTAARLKGEVNIRSETGQGTSLEICVPVSLSSLVALRSGSRRHGCVVYPSMRFAEPCEFERREIARSAEKDSIVYDGKVIPFLALTRALGSRRSSGRKRELLVRGGPRSILAEWRPLASTGCSVRRASW